MTDNHGYVLAPLPVAPVNETDLTIPIRDFSEHSWVFPADSP